MVRAVSKYSLLSILPPQSQFDWHNAAELQPITERRTGPLHRRLSVPYIRLRQGYLGLWSTTCAPRQALELKIEFSAIDFDGSDSDYCLGYVSYLALFRSAPMSH